MSTFYDFLHDFHVGYKHSNLHIICSVYIGLTVCVFGLVGNFISFGVWWSINKWRASSRKSVGFYLMVLAVIDSCMLVMSFLTEPLPILMKDRSVASFSYMAFYSYFAYPMYYFFACASVWMVIGVTANRFVAVVFPYRTHTFNSLQKSKIITLLVLAFSFIINLPHFFNFHPQPETENTGEYFAALTSYGASAGAKYYEFWIHCMFLVLIPWILIFALNSTILFKLITRKNSEKFAKNENQTTIILLTVTISFLTFLILQCLTQCFWMTGYGKEDQSAWNRLEQAWLFGKMGVIFNSALNFPLYCLSGSVFRKELKLIFSRNLAFVKISRHFDSSISLRNSKKSSTTTSVGIEDNSRF